MTGRALGIIGTLLLFAALIFLLLDNSLSTRVLVSGIVGIAGLIGWGVLAPEDIRLWLTGRQAAAGTTSFIATALFAAIVIMIYAQVEQRQLTADLTFIARYSLGQDSLQVVEQIKNAGRPIQITAFYPREYLRQREAANIILRQYDSAGDDLLHVRYVDPDQEPLFARSFGYQNLTDKEDAIFISYLTEDGNPDLTSIRYIGEANERVISTTLLEMLTVSGPLFYFTEGHTELQIDSQAGTGLSRATNVLALNNFRVATVNLLTTGRVPEDASALVIASPSSEFAPAEVEMIAAYLASGGRLIVLANPPYIDPTFGGRNITLQEDNPLNQYLWEEFGVRFNNTLVVDAGSSVGNEYSPVPRLNAGQEMFLTFAPDTTMILSLARSLEVITQPSNPTQAQYAREILLASSENSYAERTLEQVEAGGDPSDFDENLDEQGPLILGVAIRHTNEINREAGARIVLIGDVDWLTNDMLVQVPGNGLVWDAVVKWVVGSPDAVLPAAQRDMSLLPVSATDQERQRISIITTLLLPGMVLAAGFLVWAMRRNR